MSSRSFCNGILLVLFLVAPVPALADLARPEYMQAAELEERFADWRKRSLAEKDFLLKTKGLKLAKWRDWARRLPATSEADQLAGLNELISREVRFRSDFSAHGVNDHWAALSESWLKGGDSEDIALANATTLFFLGWPEERLHLATGYHPKEKDEAHYILVVQGSDGFWALDNLSVFVEPFSEMTLEPVLGVSTQGVWNSTKR